MDVWLLATQLMLHEATAIAGAQSEVMDSASTMLTATPGLPGPCADGVPLEGSPLCASPERSVATAPEETAALPSMATAGTVWPRPTQLVGPRRSSPLPIGHASPTTTDRESRSGGGLRPMSGPQLYEFRAATLQAGELYTQAVPQRYLGQWQRAIDPPTYQQWQALLAEEAHAITRLQGENSLTILVGDSLSLWLPLSDLPPQQLWLNQSISGETTAHMLRRLHYFADTRPRAIHLMGGINDLKAGVPDTEVVENFAQMLTRLRHQHPQARLVMYSILPTRLPGLWGDRIQLVNRQLSTLAVQQGATFVDLFPAFSDSQGQLRPELTTDGLHLGPQGYRLWRAALVSH